MPSPPHRYDLSGTQSIGGGSQRKVASRVSSYTITIAPDDHIRATTTLRVEVSDTAARITELLVRAGDGDGLTARQLPAVDLDQLLRAVTPATTAAITASAPTVPTVEQTPTGPAATAQPAAETVPPAAEPQPAPTEVAPTTGQATKNTTSARPRRSTTAANKTPASSTKPSARASGSTKATKATRTSKAAKPAAAAKDITTETPAARERVYRRAPEDLAEVYQQAGSAAALADHYGVPRHTAYGWIRTLRRGNTTTATS